MMLLALLGVLQAQEPAPAKIRPDEPIAAFSMGRAVEFLDRASLRWEQSRKCMTCHTDYAYLWVMPEIDPGRPALKEVRAFAEALVTERWERKGPRWDAEVVMTAVTLALHDRAAGKELSPPARRALDRMWSVQRPDGGWNWLKCEWPPMEIDDHYGTTVALIGAGAAPSDYASTPAARAGIEKARGWLRANPPPALHHEAMTLWASLHVEGLMTPEGRTEILGRLFEKQRADGGWAASSLAAWKRKDGSAQSADSDGYGTGFVLLLARRAGVPADDPRVRKGIAWLKANQRESGRWFTRSLFEDNHHFIAHAGTAYAAYALHLCGER
jgi:squalene-hopene/tetraprenyl-beta-curcumene cyclase